MKALQLYHQDRRHDEEHQRNDRFDRGLALRAFLNRASDRDRIAGWQTFCERVYLRRELVNDRLPLRAVEDACLERNRRKPRSPTDCRLLDFIAQVSDSPER